MINMINTKANVSASRLQRTIRLIRFDCQEIKLNLEFSSTKNIKCSPWLLLSSSFANVASANKTILIFYQVVDIQYYTDCLEFCL